MGTRILKRKGGTDGVPLLLSSATSNGSGRALLESSGTPSVLPDACFLKFPFGLTLEGQYIIKNLTLISAAIVIGGTVRGRSTDRELL